MSRAISITGQPAHGLYPGRVYNGGNIASYTPQQVLAWERDREEERWACLARYVIAKPRGEQVAFYRRWKARHGEASAATLAAAIRAEQQEAV